MRESIQIRFGSRFAIPHSMKPKPSVPTSFGLPMFSPPDDAKIVETCCRAAEPLASPPLADIPAVVRSML